MLEEVYEVEAAVSNYYSIYWSAISLNGIKKISFEITDSMTLEKELRQSLHELNRYATEIKTSSIDLDTYWIRKSKKVVLAVLAYNHEGVTEYVRGINMEVSLPAGSMCAERNAISTCFSNYPDLKKKDLICLAVGEYDLESETLKDIRPCCLCQAWCVKIWGPDWHSHVQSVKE